MYNDSASIIAISSGKGGVGKTTLTVNLGIALAQLGQKVCLFDGDTNLANINILLRETPDATLQDVLSGEKTISDIIIHSNGISLVPGASGVIGFEGLEQAAQVHLFNSLLTLEQQYDVILVDTSAGIHDEVLNFIQTAQQSIVLITPEPTSLTDAFSLLRALHKREYTKSLSVVVNQASSELSARKIYQRFCKTVEKYIGYRPVYLGFINQDECVPDAVCAQVPVRLYQPDSLSSHCFDRLAEQLLALLSRDDTGLSQIWRQYLPADITVPLSDALSSPVPESDTELLKEAPPAQHSRREEKLGSKVLEEYKRGIIEYINNEQVTKQEISLTLDRFMTVFYKRFKDGSGDLSEKIDNIHKINALPQKQINQLLSEPMTYFKGTSHTAEQNFSADFLSQQIDDYVTDYGKYPFNTFQALMQSISLGHGSVEELIKLDNFLKQQGGDCTASIDESANEDKEALNASIDNASKITNTDGLSDD